MQQKVRALYDQLAGRALAGRLPNFLDSDDAGDSVALNSDRMTALRRAYDPEGVFMETWRA
jgi:hypothetical protein